MKNKTYVKFVLFGILSALVFQKYFFDNKKTTCKTFLDYFWTYENQNCWHEVGYYNDVPKILSSKNYSFETHSITTEDGYILTIFQIFPTKYEKTTPLNGALGGAVAPLDRKVIFLEHSFVANSEMWVDNGNDSLAFELLDLGYEVWLGNLRGSKYGLQHLTLDVKNPKFWDFGFHEQGVYDIRSTINYISKKTQRNDIIFIGYSMAGSSSIIYGSLYPEEASKKLEIMINIGALVYCQHSRGMIKPFSYFLIDLNLKRIMDFFGLTYFQITPTEKFVFRTFCADHPLKYLCIFLNFPAVGWSNFEIGPEIAATVVNKIPDSFSMRSLYHYLQQYKNNGKFQMYDYGPEQNLQKYNSSIHPLYPIDRIKVPIYSVYGSLDYMSQKKDVENFYNDLSNEAKKYGFDEIPNLNHLDIIYSKNRRESTWMKIKEMLEKL